MGVVSGQAGFGFLQARSRRISCPMSSKRLDSIADFARHGYRLRVDCLACNRVAIMDPRRIVEICSKRGLSRDMQAIERRLRCSACGSRRVRCGPAFGD